MLVKKSVLLGTWLLVILNLILVFSSIALLNRMSPAIAKIMSENDHTIQACEKMLMVLAESNNSNITTENKKKFYAFLKICEGNITEENESQVIKQIKKYSKSALSGNRDSISKIIIYISKLTAINRDAMVHAQGKARRLGFAGAWGIAFIACFSFICGLFYIKHINKRLLDPLDELHEVFKVQRTGNSYRRCVKKTDSPYINFIFDEVNSLLDSKTNK
ncbi:MAG: hypothetical protein K9L78_04685 [Victivallales bacterium]|nr:hypothetical protein [Victivallales bacterium]MCF7889399.1 hypothetical protein [Victivallales bacterium]